MKAFLLFSLLPLSVSAGTYEFVGACSEQPVLTGVYEIPASGANVGLVSVEALRQAKVPYIGDESGLASIFGTPVGDAAIELISDRELRAYGWCYEVDGRQPDVMPDQVRLTGAEHIRWFYAFSENKNNEWVSYCVPAFMVRPKDLCGEKK